MNKYNAVIGKTIKSYKLEDAGNDLEIEFSDGSKARFNTYGDCCSHTWIENIDGEEALNEGKIISIEDIEMPNLGNIGGKRHTDVDEVSYYGLKITTDKGRAILDYRNDSNGYYGGGVGLQYPLN